LAIWRAGWAGNEQARTAYDEARTFYKQESDRLGEANVLAGLGDLESTMGRNEQARTAYDEARTLYKQESDRLGEANALRGLGDLESRLGRHQQARTAYDEAAQLFGSLGMMNYRDEALHRASLASTR
jgi:tetratricopeptide (TPR) repeat protein